MYGVVHFAPDVEALPHTFRVFGLGVPDIEPHLDMAILGPVFDDPLGQVVSGPFKLVFQFGRVVGLNKLSVIEPSEIYKADERVIRILKGLGIFAGNQGVEISLPNHLVIFIEVEKLRRARPNQRIENVRAKALFLDLGYKRLERISLASTVRPLPTVELDWIRPTIPVVDAPVFAT